MAKGAIRLRLAGLEPIAAGSGFAARVAGTWVVTDREVPALAAFAANALPAGGEAGPAVDWSSREVERVVYSGPGLVAGAEREVECLRIGQGWEVVIPGVCTLGVAEDGGEAAVLWTGSGESLVAECLLGPGLILALAARGIYCLHASAVRTPRGAIAFLGESGQGKSTLARFLAETVPGCVRLADDILPVRMGAVGIEALPRFPQLKLGRADQVSDAEPEGVPLRVACVLDPVSGEGGGGVTLEALDPLQASLALMRHTVAARLFDRAPAARHLEACGSAAGCGALRRLRYPFSSEALPGMAATLASV